MSPREEFAHDISLLIQRIFDLGFTVTLGEAYRTQYQQAKYLKQGLSTVRFSQHQKRLAQDLFIWDKDNPSKSARDDFWLQMGNAWEVMNDDNRWGGRFGVLKDEACYKVGWDRYHFERRD